MRGNWSECVFRNEQWMVLETVCSSDAVTYYCTGDSICDKCSQVTGFGSSQRLVAFKIGVGVGLSLTS